MQEKKKGSAGVIICLIGLVALAAAWVTVFIIGTGPARHFNGLKLDAIKCVGNRDYEGAVDIYKEMLEIAPGNTDALNGLDRAYMAWADYLEDDEPALSAEVMEDEAEYLAELNDIVHSKRITRLIQDVEQRAENYLNEDETDPFANNNGSGGAITDRPEDDPLIVLETAYEYMSVGDYKNMLYVDGSVEADALIQTMKDRGQDIFIYGDDYNGEKDYKGQAMGVYIVPEGYYFYYGDYVDGKREGFGTVYWRNGEGTYEMFQGYWKDDAPNGEGMIINRDEYSDYTVMVSGNFTDGLQDGKMSYDTLDSRGMSEHGEYTATDGDAPEVSTSSDPYDPYNDYYYYTTYLVLPSGTEVYYDKDTEYLGVLGFRRR